MTSPFDAYDPKSFRVLGHQFVDRIAEYLEASMATVPGQGNGPPVLQVRAPDELETEFADEFPTEPEGPGHERSQKLLEAVLAHSNHLHQRGYIGHQVSVPIPGAILWDMLSSLMNNGMAVYEMGQLQTVLERRCVRWMADRIGYGSEAGGLLTSGGSLGNLTALLAARQHMTGSWDGGLEASGKLAVLVSADAHYCVARAMQIMGQGKESVVRVPVDAQHRMRTDLLPDLFDEAVQRGRRPIAVVSSSCGTSTGAFDDLSAIADFCEARELWLHVDGAHGASHLLSDKLRHHLAGIERAHSVVWDAHKLMLVPALITGVLFREEHHAAQSFAQEASYLFEDTSAAYDLGHRTLECTKRAMGVTLYGSLLAHGTEVFAESVERTVALAQAFADHLEACSDFRLALRPETNIVCFRFEPEGTPPEDLDGLQEALRRQIVHRGHHYLVQARLGADLYLRTTLMNPRTRLEDLQHLLAEVRELHSQM